MANYIMEDKEEAGRLERMSKFAAYQPSTEVAALSFQSGHRVLDAGCGSGLVAKHIADHYPGVIVEGCDQSAVRIDQARQLRKDQGREDIRFFVSDLEAIQAEQASYDRLTCRYVFEFLPDPEGVLKEFLRVLKPGGQALVIQFDGFMHNYSHRNAELKEMLKKVEQKGPDMFLGRKLPAMFLDAGFKHVDWDVQVYGFKGEELLGEQTQMWERLGFALPGLALILGGHEAALRFQKIFCDEMTQPGNVLFYNKFLVRGIKPE